ncbi:MULTISPECIES: hypothetical protein [unclassified Crossiella]|uniref:hypothetical protein n=1 Tax=unclassified Crossiella TaxID=2620835 RepID=UPI001FFE6F3D|nr:MULTISPECIES: hypothetical protein [unclassified Crossiella]MCK2236596.1 hypothetical protein [Crossiella sp. S99.2]MCK2250263.1 hypothetical protein [Crossiella sp. S99.1]
MAGTTRVALDAALAAVDPWTGLGELVEVGPPDLVQVAEARYAEVESAQRRRLTWVLGQLGDSAGPALLRLLAAHTGDDAHDLLGTAVRGGLRVPGELLWRLAADLGDAEPVLHAMGLAADPGFADYLGQRLDTAGKRAAAAIALGRLGDRRWTEPIARRLGKVDGLEHTAFVVALELLGDPAAVPYLVRQLKEADAPGDLLHALVRLTGRDPLLPLWTGPSAESRKALWRTWSEVDPAVRAEPEIRELVTGPRRAEFELHEGRGRIRLDYDPPAPGLAWPRWNRSLLVGGQPLYQVSSDCDTCQTMLRLLGWPERVTAASADRLRTALSTVDSLVDGVPAALAPLVRELPTGHYRAYLVDLPVQRVTDPGKSWWVRRWAEREGAVMAAEDWPGVAHFQLPERIPGPMPTFGVLLPTQPRLDPDTVARHRAAIAAGVRPAAVVLGWIEDTWVEAEFPERFLVGAVLDGHHKLAAYAEAGVPARVLLLARGEDNWHPDHDWLDRFEAVLGQFSG